MLSVSTEVIQNELETVRAIVEKWQKKIEQMPGVTIPTQDPAAFENYLRELIGELQVISGKCDTLAEALGASLP
jgi:hypothetical protein